MTTDLAVGVIGVGAMGSGVAQSLLRAGFDVFVRDILPEREAALAEAGAAACPTPGELAARCDVVIVLVVDAPQIETVCFGPGGVVEAADPGTVVMMSSTVEPAYAESLGHRLEGHGLAMLDAPVSGGPAKALAGTLSMMVAGRPAAVARCKPVTDAIAARVFRVGENPGDGSKVKIVNNLLAGINLAGAAEAMALGMRLGLDERTLYEVVCASSGASWVFCDRMGRALEGDYAPRAATRILTKDVSIALAAAREAYAPVPVGAAALQVYLGALARGLGEQDDAALLKHCMAEMGLRPED